MKTENFFIQRRHRVFFNVMRTSHMFKSVVIQNGKLLVFEFNCSQGKSGLRIYFFFDSFFTCLRILIYSVNLVFCNSNRKIENKILWMKTVYIQESYTLLASQEWMLLFPCRHIMIYGQF